MKPETIVNLLLSMRSQIDAILAEYCEEQEEAKAPVECEHPKDYVMNLSVLGSNEKRYKCRLCDYEWTEKPKE
jgi:transposase-like protein